MELKNNKVRYQGEEFEAKLLHKEGFDDLKEWEFASCVNTLIANHVDLPQQMMDRFNELIDQYTKAYDNYKVTSIMQKALQLTAAIPVAAKVKDDNIYLKVDYQDITLQGKIPNIATDRAVQISCLMTLWYRGYPIAAFDAIGEPLHSLAHELVTFVRPHSEQ